MTDNEIIKVLGGISYGGHSCTKCKYKITKGEDRCGLKGCKIARNALDLINRQKAENEMLNKTLVFEINSAFERGKAEATTEFAERLKGRLEFWDCGYCGDSMADEIRQYTFDTIDQIAKEMKEENEWGMQKLQQPQGDNEVKCKECEYLMFSDCYGECRKAYKGIVNPNASCGKGKKRVKGDQ